MYDLRGTKLHLYILQSNFAEAYKHALSELPATYVSNSSTFYWCKIFSVEYVFKSSVLYE